MRTASVIIGGKRHRVEVCDSLFSKARGLMFTRRPRNLLMVFSSARRVSLHMCFVFFPIDVIFLDAKKKVVDLKKRLVPWSFYTSEEKAVYVLEVPAGFLRRYAVRRGQVVKF